MWIILPLLSLLCLYFMFRASQYILRGEWKRAGIHTAAVVILWAVLFYVVFVVGSPQFEDLSPYPSLTCAGIRCRDYDGAQIVFVAPGSVAEMSGLRPGDIILRANGRDITNCADLESVFREAGSGQVVIEVMLRRVTPTPSGTSG